MQHPPEGAGAQEPLSSGLESPDDSPPPAENQPSDLFADATARAEPVAPGADRRKAEPPAPGEKGVDFDWRTTEPLIPEQSAVAVYENTAGNIVVRRALIWGVEDEDALVIVTPSNARILAGELVALADALEGWK